MRHLDPARQHLAVGLAALAGFVDATGFLSAGGYFASFMSGNTTRLGVDLAHNLSAAVLPATLIGGFVLGVVAGAILSELGGARRKTSVLAFVLSVLIAAAVLDRLWPPGFVGAAVVAMGATNNVFRRNGEVAVGVTYMTGALVRLGQGLAARLLGRGTEGRLSAIGLWLGLATGAFGGAFSFAHMRTATPWLAVTVCAVLLAAAVAIERRSGQASN